MTTKDELHELVDRLGGPAVDELLDYARWLAQDVDTLTKEERARVEAGEAEVARGEYTSLDELRERLGT